MMDLVATLDYSECMSLAYDLFFENPENSDFQDFSIKLFFVIRDHFAKKWDTDWKNDAFLGQLCGLTWRYDESYECYKKAYDKLKDPPDFLLLLLSGCNSAPGIPPISDGESEMFLKGALAKKVTYEAAVQMKGLSRIKKNSEQENYWDEMCKELKERNIHTDILIPDVLHSKV